MCAIKYNFASIFLSCLIVCLCTFGKAHSDEGECHLNLKTCAVDVGSITGFRGEKGDPGMKGDKGDAGKDGEKGERGFPGSCNCKCPPSFGFSEGSDDNPTDESRKPIISCKYMDPISNGTQLIRLEDPFDVECTFGATRNSSCLLKSLNLFNETKLEEISFECRDKPFWLSEIPTFSLEDFYFGNIMNRIEYLRADSTFVTQKIRFHCKNWDGNFDLALLSWKEQLVLRSATSEHPFHYNIVEDGCIDASSGWSYTDIELIGHYGRLPILDFLISNTKDGDKKRKFYVELLELCFSG